MTAQPEPAVTVVIPTFNRAAELMRALQVLGAQEGGPPHVVVVDNSSTDDTAARVQAAMPAWGGRLRYLRKAPEGPAAARNAGLALATTPLVLYHDSDIELQPGWLQRAQAHMARNPALAAAGGYIVYAFDPQRVNAYGGDLGRFGLAWDVCEDTPLDPARGPADRIWINCSAMLARADAVRAAGGFDDTFFYGFEDADLGWRLNALGLRVAVFPDLVAHHKVEAAPGAAHPQIVFHYCKNRLRMILRNAQGWFGLGTLLGYLGYTGADLVLRGPRGAKLRALAWNLAHLGQTLALRKPLAAQRRVGDAAIFALGSRRWWPPTPLGGRRRRAVAEAAGATRGPYSDDRV